MSGSAYRVSIVGLGHVGLPLAAVTSKLGAYTVGADIDQGTVDALRSGRTGFFEPGMDAIIQESVGQGMLSFTSDVDHAVQNTDITFLTVGTPMSGDGGMPVTSHLLAATEHIRRALEDKDGFHTVVIKSTVPPLTTEARILPIFEDMMQDGRAGVVVNPEFLSEGAAIRDLLNPHLIVLGSNDCRCLDLMEDYYRGLYDSVPEILRTTIPNAEMIKYANNAFLATKVSFINTISAICEDLPGADVDIVAYGIGKDPNIGPHYLKAGPGFGGSCLPRDLNGMIGMACASGREDLFNAVKYTNDQQVRRIIGMISQLGALTKHSTVSLLGLAFKKDTSDIREAVSVRVTEDLLECGTEVRAHDPMALPEFESMFEEEGDVSCHESVPECLDGSDCCVILTDWDEYRKLKRDTVVERMRSANIIDCRRILDEGDFDGVRFRAIGIGMQW